MGTKIEYLNCSNDIRISNWFYSKHKLYLMQIVGVAQEEIVKTKTMAALVGQMMDIALPEIL